MYNSQDKSYYNSHSNRTNRPYESKRWDHNGYYQFQTDKDQKYKYDDKNDKYRKPRRFQNDNTIAYNIADPGPPKDQKTIENKETIDKTQEVSIYTPRESVTNDMFDSDRKGKPIRREKKPDRQLYSVRGKRGNHDEVKGGKQEDEGKKKSDDMMKREASKEAGNSEKEAHNYEDDTKSFISNVSTSVSDPFKGGEEDLSKDNIGSSGQKRSEDSIKKESSEVLFEIVLDSDKREHLKIYENEEDYEGFLDGVCIGHNMSKRVSLYFKINMLIRIQKVHPEPQKVTEALDRLLEVNYKVIMVENGFRVMDEVVAPYFEEKDKESFMLDNALEEIKEEVRDEEICLKEEEDM